jgi:uncharacterized damage-inducible protein DinB
METEPVTTADRAGLVSRIQRSWDELHGSIARLDAAGMVEPGTDGWSVKDHLAHLAAWEGAVLSLLDGQDPLAAMGVAPGDTEVENEQIRERYAGRPLAEVRELAERTHSRLLERLSAMSDADLARPLSSFRPDVDSPNKDKPITDWIPGNTWEHFDEHRDWIATNVLRKQT